MKRRLNQPGNMPPRNDCLIISQSARALAESAASSAIHSHTIDCFADQETRTIADSWRMLGCQDGMLDSMALLDLLKDYESIPISHVVTGSGMEACSKEVYDFISRRWSLCGNDYHTVQSCKDPAGLQHILEKAAIPTPAIALERKQNGRWKIKKRAGSGGGHVRDYVNGSPLPEGSFLQESITGATYSVVFLGNGQDARLIGVNETWQTGPGSGDYRYAGTATCGRMVPERLYKELINAIIILVRELQLKGLCGLDIIVTDAQHWYVLELNPRPTASFEHYDVGNHLLQAHIQACMGHLPETYTEDEWLRGSLIVYADRGFIMPVLDWPIWISDRPLPGTEINAGEPVCSLKARAGTHAGIKELLDHRQSTFQHLLESARHAA